MPDTKKATEEAPETHEDAVLENVSEVESSATTEQGSPKQSASKREGQRKGAISIHSENIFPIIKKSLYADHEIFLRELVSNAVDAIQKLKTLSGLGQAEGELGELKVIVSMDAEAKTITVSDNGLGMTEEEVEKYITQVAFSGAKEFVEKFKDETQPIIGQFGLGFYSAFMVAREVELLTRSFTQPEPNQATLWVCDGSTEYSIGTGERAERGTTVTLHIAEDSEEFLDSWRIKNLLKKYARFLPVPVEFEETIINETAPIWTKSPSSLTDEDYTKFYSELYPGQESPLFWIHLNVDFPFNLTGILYFPKLQPGMEVERNKIQLFSKQVFITDKVEDIVPEYLRLLHGVIDSPDIPLNVSRSYLQTDGNVRKINAHITKKVADKLSGMFNNDREAFEAKWSDMDVFTKYGILTDEKFAEKAMDFLLVKSETDAKLRTIEEYREHITTNQTDKDGNVIGLYTTDPNEQRVAMEAAHRRHYDVLSLTGPLDAHFAQRLEMHGEGKMRLKRVDAATPDELVTKDEPMASLLTEEQTGQIKEIFTTAKPSGNFEVEVKAMGSDDLPLLLTQEEFMRRFSEMSRMGGGMAGFGSGEEHFNAVVNASHPVISSLLTLPEDKRHQAVAHIWDLALLAQGRLKGEALSKFVYRSAASLPMTNE